MYTVQQLRDLAIRYDLPKRSKLRKDDLQKAIQALKDPIITEKLKKRPKKFANINNENELLRNQALQLLNAEVDYQLIANAYDKKLKKDPNLKIAAQNRLKSKQILRKIIKEGPKILQEKIGLKDSVEKGRRMIKFRFFNELDNNLSNEMIEKLQPYLTTSCYLRYSYTYRLRNIENKDVILYHKNLAGSPWINEISEAQNG